VAGCGTQEDLSPEDVRQEIQAAVMDGRDSLSEIARDIAAKSGISKNKIYKEALKIKKELNSG
jgi:methanogenic corrinoid protein MtbC1